MDWIGLGAGSVAAGCDWTGVICSANQRVSKGMIVQGPLKSTSEDFWQMVFEQRSTAVLMLTRTTENFHEKVTPCPCSEIRKYLMVRTCFC